jgi:hypothetical protein
LNETRAFNNGVAPSSSTSEMSDGKSWAKLDTERLSKYDLKCTFVLDENFQQLYGFSVEEGIVTSQQMQDILILLVLASNLCFVVQKQLYTRH